MLIRRDFMRNKLLAAVAFSAFAAACARPAAAADVPWGGQPPTMQQQPVAAPSPPYVTDWVGFYFGFNGGGGWDHASFDSPPGLFLPGASLNGSVIGGHAGYNWQYVQIVGGVEVDFSSADLTETSLVGSPADFAVRNSKIDELASARGRLGFAILHNVLAYGTGGLGWAHTRVTIADAAGSVTSADENAFGWVAGAGLEYRLFEHVLLRAEYLHYELGTVTLPALLSSHDNIGIRNGIDVVRGGISYKF
jgi:opacity protein-like surface antigen